LGVLHERSSSTNTSSFIYFLFSNGRGGDLRRMSEPAQTEEAAVNLFQYQNRSGAGGTGSRYKIVIVSITCLCAIYQKTAVPGYRDRVLTCSVPARPHAHIAESRLCLTHYD
jgi:hypothetical protein